MLRRLPKEAPPLIESMAYSEYLLELGGHLAIYKRVSLADAPELQALMSPDDWDAYYQNRRKRWVAECTCTACGESWHTAWVGGPLKSILVLVGEDGVTYPISDPEDPDAIEFRVELSSNDGVLCPICGENVTLIHRSQIKSGMTRRLALCNVDNIDSYTTILYWLSRRHIDADGLVCEEISPWRAIVIDEFGRLQRFCYHPSGWKFSPGRGDPFYSKYTSGDGGAYNFRQGGFVNRTVPSLLGCTGEKTGLGEYVRSGGTMPLLYMHTWQRKPAIENLVNAGWSPLIESLFMQETNYCQYELPAAGLTEIDWSKKRPHEMLSMDKASFRMLTPEENGSRRREWFQAWKSYLAVGGKLPASEFDTYWRRYTQYGMNTLLTLLAQVPGLDIPKIDRYLAKQNIAPTEVRLLADTWRMTEILYGRQTLTSEEMWPKYLIQKHDQLAALNILEKGKESWTMYLAGFRRIYEKYQDLQWTDGDLQILIPRDNGELVREGDILRHCVGTYGESHVTESSTIFFVRRHRRPERCYYTLAMNLKGIPKRSQLHGYGNERHGPNKEYKHSIPKKVLDFCDRWEKEILMPWFWRQQKQKSEMKKEISA